MKRNSTEMVNKYINPKMKYEDALEVAKVIGSMIDNVITELGDEEEEFKTPE